MQESRLKAPSYPPPTASCRKESKTPAPQQALDSNREQLTQTVGSTDIPRLPLTLAARGSTCLKDLELQRSSLAQREPRMVPAALGVVVQTLTSLFAV